MPRFAGTNPSSVLNTAIKRGGSPGDFSGIQFSGSGGEGIAGAASTAGSIGAVFNSLKPPGYDAIAKNAIENIAAVNNAGTKIRADLQASILSNASKVSSAVIGADATQKVADITKEAYKYRKEVMESASNKAKGDKKSGDIVGTLMGVAGTALSIFSDERTKHSVERLDDVTLMLRELNPVSFYYKEDYTNDPERMHYGFIAQEYKQTMPDATYYDRDSGMLTIDINQLIALLVRGYQQLDNRVTRMEAKNVLAGVS